MIDLISSKYTFVCDPDKCDTLIELTTSDGFGFPAGVTKLTCPCGRQMSYLGCTILPTETKGNQMLDNLEASIDATNYNPNLLVTYKSIKNGEVTYPTLKMNELEYELDSYRRQTDRLNEAQSKINQIIDNLSADGWYNPNTEKSEVLNDLCEILGHEPKQSVTITATVNVEVTYDIPLEDVEDFDARYFLQDNLSIDSYNGDVCIESFDVEDADVNY